MAQQMRNLLVQRQPEFSSEPVRASPSCVTLDEADAAYKLFDNQTTGKGVFVF